MGTIYIDRQGGIIYSEFMLCAVISSTIIVKLFALQWAWGIALFFPLTYCFYFLFFKFFLFRWAFSIAASFGWAYFIFSLFEILINSPGDRNSWILACITFVFMLWVHRDEYKFESTANISIFDYLKDD